MDKYQVIPSSQIPCTFTFNRILKRPFHKIQAFSTSKAPSTLRIFRTTSSRSSKKVGRPESYFWTTVLLLIKTKRNLQTTPQNLAIYKRIKNCQIGIQNTKFALSGVGEILPRFSKALFMQHAKLAHHPYYGMYYSLKQSTFTTLSFGESLALMGSKKVAMWTIRVSFLTRFAV